MEDRRSTIPANGHFCYCPYCATALIPIEKSGRMRMACPQCGFVHYRNPTVGVATVVLVDGNAILLGRRASHSAYPGTWCIPCGHVEWGEDVREAARRECLEETGLEVRVGEVVAVHSNFHNPQQHTVGVWFRCEIAGGELRAGDDLDRVAWFSLDAIPEPLAFPTDRLVLDALRKEREVQNPR